MSFKDMLSRVRTGVGSGVGSATKKQSEGLSSLRAPMAESSSKMGGGMGGAVKKLGGMVKGVMMQKRRPSTSESSKKPRLGFGKKRRAMMGIGAGLSSLGED